MIVVDPGHLYHLDLLDISNRRSVLRFVKREGPKYPGNVGHYPGTNCQEPLRAIIDRLDYVNKQIPSIHDTMAIDYIRLAISALEDRAAELHGRPKPTIQQAVYGITCSKCRHVGCKGECHG